MFARGLKTNIIVIIAALLMLAMLLTDLVVTMRAQQDLVQSEGEKGYLLLSNLNNIIRASDDTAETDLSKLKRENFLKLPNQEGFSCALILSVDGNTLLNTLEACGHTREIDVLVRQSMGSGRRQIKPVGETWGVFWKQPHTILIATPLLKKNRVIAGAGLALPLEGVYQSLRQSQQILFLYMVLNLVILTGIGLFRLSKVYLQPIRRLVNRAEEYREDDDEILFSVRKGDSELNILSKSLNRMLKRISADKEKLRATVQSLEKANLDLNQAQSEIIRAEKLAAVGRLSSGIAHEIGNPIGIVMGYLELLKQQNISELEKKDYLVRTENEIQRINTIIRQLLDLSRPVPKVSKTVSVHGLIEEMAHVLRVQPLMSKVHLQLQLSAVKDVIMADAEKLRQVFLNLAINAADAIAAGENIGDGQLTIQTEVLSPSDGGVLKQQETLKIMFEDNGPGISPEHLENIFDPFFTTKDPGKGTGLGLSVSFMIIDGMGGVIKAASRPGCGTTLSVYLPLHAGGDADGGDL
ncbi:MAG: ATP-binding protein [Desulfobacterales bacterium]|nr:ATP-binding protein [Desulfobacterales bacterium]